MNKEPTSCAATYTKHSTNTLTTYTLESTHWSFNSLPLESTHWSFNSLHTWINTLVFQQPPHLNQHTGLSTVSHLNRYTSLSTASHLNHYTGQPPHLNQHTGLSTASTLESTHWSFNSLYTWINTLVFQQPLHLNQHTGLSTASILELAFPSHNISLAICKPVVEADTTSYFNSSYGNVNCSQS